MTKNVQCECECGRGTGVRCAWSGPESETVTVRVLPESMRAEARKIREGTGSATAYIAQGEMHLTCERSCAEGLLETEGEWARLADAEGQST